MAYKPALQTKVEALGATFWFGAADAAMARVVSAASDLASLDTDAVPSEMIAPLCDLFVAACRDWEEVEDGRGRKVSCTAQTRADIPTMDKVAVAAAYLIALQGIAEKGGPADGPATNSTPPGMAVEDGGESRLTASLSATG